MKLVYKGKTKDVYALDDGNYLLDFKDDVTGVDGVYDPGANSVGLSIEGVGQSNLSLSVFFFERLRNAGIPNHFIDADLDAGTMTVKPAAPFGKGVEVVCRLKAVGGFVRRYGLYAKEGMALPHVIEFTLKDDGRDDPLINAEALSALGIMTPEEYGEVSELTRISTDVVQAGLDEYGLELYDLKFEYGRVNGKVVMIDEVSPGNMRIYRDGVFVPPLEVAKIMF